MRIGFDHDKYTAMQSQHIRERIDEFGGKLYLELGGKLFDDYHASRVLPGFRPDSKMSMLLNLKDQAELVIAINADDIEKSKVRGDLGITYDADVLRLIDSFRGIGLYVGSVVMTRWQEQRAAVHFKQHLESVGVKVYRHFPIEGYPYSVQHIVSDEGFGRNEYIETSRPLVLVTAPGPGSGKMATCLSQLYQEHQRGVKAGYAKFETFPIWNLPLTHPVNVAYEAATADLDDVNMIDPFHLEAYGVTTVNYNRDIEIFPVLNALFEHIYGESPYKSPTDMGVNMIKACIIDDDVCRAAARQEIIRRYYSAQCALRQGKAEAAEVQKLELLMRKMGLTDDERPSSPPLAAAPTKPARPPWHPASGRADHHRQNQRFDGPRRRRRAERGQGAGRHREKGAPHFSLRDRAYPNPEMRLSGQSQPPAAFRRDPAGPFHLRRNGPRRLQRDEPAQKISGLRSPFHRAALPRG